MGTNLGENTLLQPTGHVCADCAEDIVYSTETVRLQVVEAQLVNGRMHTYPVIDEHDLHGDFLFEPFVFDITCWENLLEAVKEDLADVPPLLDPHSPFECSCCGSGIREWEYAGAFTIGEFRVSKRAPNGVYGPWLAEDTAPELICMACLSNINEDHIDMWEGLSQHGECTECIAVRCTREEACNCECHEEE